MGKFPPRRHIDFINQRYDIRIVPTKQLGFVLPEILENINRNCAEVAVLPGEVAFEGSWWQLETPSHIFYTKRLHDYEGRDIIYPSVKFVGVRKGEVRNLPLDSPELDYRKKD